VPVTKGFRDPPDLSDHFIKHGSRLGIADENAYAERADDFLGRSREPGVYEFRRPWNNDLVRYDPATEEFGVLSEDGYIKTYYKPEPARQMRSTLNMRGQGQHDIYMSSLRI